jgi:hypothetical protein
MGKVRVNILPPITHILSKGNLEYHPIAGKLLFIIMIDELVKRSFKASDG